MQICIGVGFMISFPLFIDLSSKKCIVIGGGQVATRKVENLLLFNACITVISPAITGRLSQLAEQGKITVIHEEFSAEHLTGAFLAIAATSKKLVNESIYSNAVQNGIWINVVDCPSQCTFIFPAIVKRDGMVIGISSSGLYPALSKNIRQKLESFFPERYNVALPVLSYIRKRAGLEIPDIKTRSGILNRLAIEIDSFMALTSHENLKAKIINRYEDLKNETTN
jgi:precorrin-2 dehydrogenase/sirohydrochlorin ferrochelatase